ncbi:MAG: permease [Bdellovibrio sp.]|nr:MAG: permease [Bdellovibrio sp.]
MFFIAWRQLTSKKKQTLLILLGISFGTLCFVTISGIQLGMRKYIFSQLLNNTAHVLISGAEQEIEAAPIRQIFYSPEQMISWIVPPAGKRDEERLENYAGWSDRLKADPDVLDFSPRLPVNAIATHGKFTASISMIGMIPERQVRISNVESYMKQGSFQALKAGGNNIIIGSGVAKKIGAQLNQIINVSSGRGPVRPFKIVGLIHFGNQQVDDSLTFAHLKNAQSLNRSPGRVAEIAVALTDPDLATEAATRWQLLSQDKVQDWQQANKVFMEMIKVQDFSRYFITGAILIVASFGIYNVLTIMISQKRKEIAILRAIGYGPGRILELILYQGILMGVSGGVLGLLFGFLMCRWIESIDFGFEIGGSNHLLLNYDFSIYMTAFVTATVSSMVASFLPAWAASRMTPMDIIRSET